MVTTRRQSGKLPLPLAAVSVEDLEDEGDIADSAVKSSGECLSLHFLLEC
jgi:hypothetical protein